MIQNIEVFYYIYPYHECSLDRRLASAAQSQYGKVVNNMVNLKEGKQSTKFFLDYCILYKDNN